MKTSDYILILISAKWENVSIMRQSHRSAEQVIPARLISQLRLNSLLINAMT